MSDHVCTREDEVRQVVVRARPHVVILGAGASRAACPRGDANGHSLPLMADLVDVVGIRPLLENEIGSDFDASDFEQLYDAIASRPSLDALCKAIERAVHDYFSALKIPREPTVYDYLVLSLRGKDIVASFNWDPLLIQAYQRSMCVLGRDKLPNIAFLHGNVAQWQCGHHHPVYLNYGSTGGVCRRCGGTMEPSRLLFPVANKDYTTDPCIAAAWSDLAEELKETRWLTLFGYRAPKSDAAAMQVFQAAWGPASSRVMEEIEIIDIRAENELLETWEPLIHSHHYQVASLIANSSLGRHPRRTHEAYIAQYQDMAPFEGNPPPVGVSLSELHKWYRELVRYEEETEAEVAPEGS